MTRRHDIDALRVLAFALLILYHLAMLYVADWQWHLKSPYLAEWLQWPMLFVNRWRMDLIFLLSGIASAFLLDPKRLGRFLWLRHWRLVLPLVFGMAVVVPIQPYVQGVSNGLVEPGFGRFLLEYFGGREWPREAFDGWENSMTWNHLWYLAYLWVYTLLLAASLPLLRTRPGQRLQAAVAGLRGWRLWLLPMLPLVLYIQVLMPRFEETHDLLNDWFLHAQFLTVFLYGFVLARSERFWSELRRLRRPLAAAAIAMIVVYVPLLKADIEFAEPALVAIRGWRGMLVWTTLLAILAWSQHALDRPFRWLPYASEAVFPWYILHQSATVLIAYWLVPLQLGAGIEATLVVAGTVATCALGFELVRRVGVLRPLFGLKRRAPSGGAQPEALAVVGGSQ
jgi:glucan biosynthesis protein C